MRKATSGGQRIPASAVLTAKPYVNLTPSDGIDMDYFFSVSSIVQDNQGNIWFGTQYSKQIATFPHGTTPDPNINKQPEGGIYATMVNHGKNSRPKTDYPVQTFKK